MTGAGDDLRGRLLGRPWLIVGFVLTVSATLALVLSNDLRWLRLGIVAALWAALIGAFLAMKYRKHAAQTEDAVAEAQTVYELELEREIAARREFELEIEAETKERADAESRDELDALRAEVVALRESLQSLFGGEVFYERVALTAQATRMRSIKDDRLVTASDSNGKPAPAQLVAGKSAEVIEHPTELIERVIEKPAPPKPSVEKRRAVQHPQSPPAAARPQQAEENGPPTRRVSRVERLGAVAAPAAKAAEQIRTEANRRKAPAAKPAAAPPKTLSESAPVAQPKPALPEPAQQSRKPPDPSRPAPERPRVAPNLTRPAMDRIERGRAAASVRPPEPEPGEPEPVEPADRDGDWTPSWDTDLRDSSVSDPGVAFPSRRALEPVLRHVDDALSSRHGSNDSSDDQPDPRDSEANTTLPGAVQEIQQARPGGRRRRDDDDDDVFPTPTPKPTPQENPKPLPTSSGGRRRRPQSEPPPWEELAESEPVNGSRHSSNGRSGSSRGVTNGSQATSDPAERNGSNGRRAAAARGSRYEEQEPAGADSRAAGRSVAELLAANGAGDVTPRRRRRAEE
jgi:hypothetical protein